MEQKQSLIDKNKANAVSEFDEALVKLKIEFEQNIYGIDPLKKEDVERVLSLFNKRLVIFQYDYIKYLKSLFAETNNVSVRPFNFQKPDSNSINHIYSGIVACGGSVLALSLITVSQTTFFVFTSTMSLGALIGSAIGVGTGWATAGVGVAAGVGVGFAVNRLTRNSRRKKIRNLLIEKYTKEVEPSLREWAEKTIDKISNHQELL